MQNSKLHLFAWAFVGCLWLALLSGCTLPKENPRSAQDASPAASPNDAAATSSSRSPFKVSELVNEVVADQENWMGKKVTVSGLGYVSRMPGSDGVNGYVIYMNDEHNSDSSQWQIICKFSQGNKPGEFTSKTVEVEGKIESAHRQSYLNLKSVTLNSCELIK